MVIMEISGTSPTYFLHLAVSLLRTSECPNIHRIYIRNISNIMASTSNVLGQVSADIQLANGPEDGISGLSWSPVSRHLAVASWEGKVRIYDMTRSRSGEGRALIDFGGPALSCSWSKV